MSGNFVALPSGAVSIHLEDAELAVLGVDPYSDTAWTGERLTELVGSLRDRGAALRRTVEAQILRAHGQRVIAPWMEPLVERALAGSAEHAVYERVLVLAVDAAHRRASLVFEAD